jgi:hypothetical protein
MSAKYLLTVDVPAGLNILDRPSSQSQGALRRRAVGVGTPLEALLIVTPQGVPYAKLVPQNPQRPEWVRMGEAGYATKQPDGSFTFNESIKHYVVVDEMPPDPNDMVAAVNRLADAIFELVKSRG